MEMFAFGALGLGLGLTITSAISVQAEYFLRFRNFALSLTCVGVPIALFAFPRLFLFLLETFSLRGAFLVNAGLLLNLVVCGAIMKPRKEPNKKAKLVDSVCDRSLACDIRFYLLCITCFCWNGGGASFFTIINSLVTDHGLTTSDGAWVVSSCGIADFAGRLTGTIISQVFPHLNRTLTYSLSHVLIAVAVIGAAAAYSMAGFLAAAVGYGVGFGLLITSFPVVIIQEFGVTTLAQVQGMSCMVGGVGCFIVAMIAGTTTNYYDGSLPTS